MICSARDKILTKNENRSSLEIFTYRAEASKAVGAADERVAVLHAKAFHEDGAVSVGVSFELHRHGNIVTDVGFFERLVGFHALPVSHEDGCVLGGLDRRARVPAELVAERVVGLLSHGDATAVALVADDFVTGCLRLMDHLHGSEDVDTGVETALV